MGSRLLGLTMNLGYIGDIYVKYNEVKKNSLIFLKTMLDEVLLAWKYKVYCFKFLFKKEISF